MISDYTMVDPLKSMTSKYLLSKMMGKQSRHIRSDTC